MNRKHFGAWSAAFICSMVVLPCDIAAPATQPAAFVMPDATPAGKPHFESKGAQVGQQLPNLPMFGEQGEPTRLADAFSSPATLLITSSYTCPKSRSEYPQAAALAKKLKNRVNIAIVYVIEAHPNHDPSPYSGVEDVTNENRLDHVLCAQPRTLKERLALAALFRSSLHVDAPIFVDAMDNAAWKSLGGGPNMGVLVDGNGIVLARQGWFDAASMEKAADVLLAALPDQRHEPEGDFSDFKETDPTMHGDLEQVKAQIAKSPALITRVFPYFPRGQTGDMTLLHYAIGSEDPASQHFEIVKFLVEKGADVNEQTLHAPSPLHLAARNGNVAIVKFLIDHGADVNAAAPNHGPTPLQEALIHGHPDVANLLAKSGAKSNFFADVGTGHLQAVQEKIAVDWSVVYRPDGWSRPPLAYAAAGNQPEMVQLLLDAGAHDLPIAWWNNEECAIWWAAQSKNVSMIKLLCDHGSDPNLLDVAISIGSMDVTRELLAHKADPNRDDIRGYKPLHNAAVFDHADIAGLLLKAGADPNAPTGKDHRPCGSPFNELATPLHLAAQAGATNIISLLIKAGAKLNAPDASGRTPLHYATEGYRPAKEMLSAVTALEQLS